MLGHLGRSAAFATVGLLAWTTKWTEGDHFIVDAWPFLLILVVLGAFTALLIDFMRPPTIKCVPSGPAQVDLAQDRESNRRAA